MSDYYRFRFNMFKGWNPKFGYELFAPAAVFGVILLIVVLYLTSPNFGFLVWRSVVPIPGKVAFGFVDLLLTATYFADDMKRPGLWLVAIICSVALIATVPLTYSLSERYAQGFYEGMDAAPSAVLVGAAFALYSTVMLALTVDRLRATNDR